MGDSFGLWLGKAIGLNGHISGIGEGYAVLLTAVLIVIGWYVSSRNERNTHRRQNAHRYVIEHDQALKDLVNELIENLINNTPFPQYTSPYPPEFKSVLTLLAKMEMISSDIRHGLVSERYIRNTQISMIITIFEISKEFIWSARNIRQQPTAYFNYECLYELAREICTARISGISA